MAKEKILSGLPKGIQTPSKEDNDDLSIDVICGSLASLIYGEKSVDSPDALRNLLSREPKIYSVISSSISESTQNITKSIKDNIKITKDNISESLLNQTNTLNSSIISLGESISMSFDVLNANNDAFVEKILESIPHQNGENGSAVIDNKTLEFVSNVERQFSLLIQSLIAHQKEFNNSLETSLNKLENIDYKLKLDVNVDGNNDIVTLLSNIKNINISDLDNASIQAKNIVGALNNIINVISKLNEVDGNAKIDVDNINAILDERETINKIVDNLSNFELKQLQAKDIQAKEIIASINAISNVISKLNEIDGTAKINVDNINVILDEKETINKIIDNLSNFELNELQAKDIQAKEIIASINAISNVISKLNEVDGNAKIDVDNINAILDKKETINKIIDSLSNFELKQLQAKDIQAKEIIASINAISNVISKLNEVDGTAKIDVDNINAILDERETINKIIDSLSNFELNQLQPKDIQAKEIIASINAISNVISKLNEVDGTAKIDVDNINAILDKKETINKIIDSLSNFELNELQAKDIQTKEIIASINAISNVISKLNNIKESEDIDMTKIQKILDQGDAIYYISDELNKFANVNIDLSNSKETLTNISSIVKVLLGLDKNLSKINNVLEKNTPDFSNVKKLSAAIRKLNVKDLITELNTAFPKKLDINFDEKNIEKLSKSLDVLTKFLSLNEIDKVIETSSKKLRKFRKQMFRIGSVYIESINALINQLNSDAFTVLDDKKTKSIKQTFTVIDYITSFSMDEDNLDELANTFDYLSYIIKNNLNDFLDTLKDKEFVDKINYIINSKLIDDVIIITENLGKLNEVILPMKTLLSMTIRLAIINKQTEIIANLIKTISSIENVENAANNLKTINEKILTKLTVKSSENLGELFASFFNIYKISKKIKFDKLLESTNSLIEILKLFKNVKINKDIDKIGVICSSLSKTVIYFGLAAPFVKLAQIGLRGLKLCINNILEVLEQLKDVDTSKIQSIMTDFTKIVIISGAILIAGALFMTYAKIPDLIAFTVCLGTFIASTVFVYTKSIKDIKDSIGISKDFALLLTLSGAILIAGGLFMKEINIVDLLSFTATLGGFILAVSWAYSIAKTTDAFKNAKDFALLIAVSGGILIAGALFMKVINIVDLFAFAGILAGFILAVSYAYAIPMKIAKKFSGLNPFDAAKDFALLIAISGGILIAGGLFMKIINWKDLAIFTGTLATFIAAICFAYSIQSIFAKTFSIDPMENAKDFALLVAVSGAILIAGGLFMKVINWGDLVGFGVTLALFIVAICGAYTIPSLFKGSMKNAKDFTLLVAVSGAILIAGGLFMKIINIEDLVTFAVTLGAFIFAICYAYGLAGKHIKKSMPNAYALAVLTAIAGATLLIGGYLMMENPGLAVNVMIFAGILIAYIGAMGVITWLLSKVGAKIGIGLAAIAGILLITYGATKVIEAVKEAVGDGGADYWITLLEGLGSIALLITAVGGIAYAAGVLVAGPQALLFAAGAAAMATISGVAVLAATAVKNVASAMRDINAVKNFDGKSIISNLKEFIKIVDVLEPLSDKSKMILKVSMAMTSMGVMMSVLSNAVKNYSSLTVPEYDAQGRPTGKKIKLNDGHFIEASDNVAKIITTLGGAIIGAYNSAPSGMFESTGFLGLGNTPFAKVSKSLSTMGPMLTTLAEAVRDYASLRIPTYDKNGNKNGTRPLTSKDFINAALNVGLLVSCLGGAIIDTYNKVESNSATKGMFDSSGWLGKGDSIFAKVTKALSTMGPMLSSISAGVKDYADLRITTYDDNGKPIGTRSMIEDDFKNAAKHVSQIVTTVGNAIVGVYNEKPSMFTLNQNSNPMLKIAQACTEMGNMINTIADGVYKYATLEIPKYDENGNKIGTIRLGSNSPIFKEAADNITTVITTMGNGIMGAFSAHPDWFKGQTVKIKDGGWFGSDEYKETGSTLFEKVISGCSLMTNLITTVASVVLKFAGEEIEEIVNGKPTGKYLKIGKPEIKKATDNVTDIFKTFSNIIDNVSKNKLFTDVESVDSIKSTVNSMISIINSSGKAIQDFSNMNLENVIDGNVNIDGITKSLLAIAKIHHLLFEDDKYIDNMFVNWKFNKTFYNEFNSNSNREIRYLKNALESISEIVSEIIKTNESLNTQIANSTVLSTEKIEQICNAFGAIKEKIDSLFVKNENTNSSFLSSITNAFATSDEAETNRKFKLYLRSINDFIELGEQTYSNNLFAWQQIALGIGIINREVNNITENTNKNLKEHVESIDKYITKINTLDMSKVNSLANLVNSLNLLAFKMGNLDNFTEALSEKLSKVLADLTIQLQSVDKSITNAQSLQDSRKKAIEESVKKIKEIMNQTLSVEISKKDENDKSGSGSGVTTPTTSTTNSGGSRSSETVPTGEVDSPMTTNRTEEQGKRAKQSSSGNVSTEVAKAISTVFGSGVKAKINNKEVILTT